jgi:dephospho-CoA kinase
MNCKFLIVSFLIIFVVKLVLGLCGAIGAGKDTMANHLKLQHNAFVIGMGDTVREEVDKLGMEQTRENQQNLAMQRRAEFGADYWAKKVIDKIISAENNVAVINGVRTVVEVETARGKLKEKFKLILIEAPPETRFQRLLLRKRAGDPANMEDFQSQERSEWEKFKFAETFRLADAKIGNSSSIEAFHAEIDKLLKTLAK